MKHSYLPYLTCLWLTENSLACAGYDCYPVLWRQDDSGVLTYINKLDQGEKKAGGQHVRYVSTRAVVAGKYSCSL